MENNYYPDQDVEETGPDNEFLELVLTVGKNFQSWDKTLNFFTEYCHQKGFSYRKRHTETIEISSGIICISKRTLECSHSYIYKPWKIDDTNPVVFTQRGRLPNQYKSSLEIAQSRSKRKPLSDISGNKNVKGNRNNHNEQEISDIYKSRWCNEYGHYSKSK